MGPRHTSIGNRALLSALAAAGISVLARADLAPASPFLPANAQAADAAAGPSGPIELRGVMAMDSATAYCIYDVAKKKSTWVGMNETGHDFVVKSADNTGEGVTVDYQGRVMRLTLHKAKIASSGPAPFQGPPANNSAISSTVVVNPSPADEQRRLDAVAQEVRRRRMERERAASQTPGAPPASIPNR